MSTRLRRSRGLNRAIRTRNMSCLALAHDEELPVRSRRSAVSRSFSSVDPPVVHVDAAAADRAASPRPSSSVTPASASSRHERASRPARTAIVADGTFGEHLQQLVDRHRADISPRTASAPPLRPRERASSPCTRRVTSRASSRCACRFSGSRALACLELLDPRRDRET